MNDTNDGGPAFPRPGVPHISSPEKGMSLRDWFAGMALQGMMANPAIGFSLSATQSALTAFSQADAMLAARDGKESANHLNQ